MKEGAIQVLLLKLSSRLEAFESHGEFGSIGPALFSYSYSMGVTLERPSIFCGNGMIGSKSSMYGGVQNMKLGEFLVADVW
jgi:hypothetical protein